MAREIEEDSKMKAYMEPLVIYFLLSILYIAQREYGMMEEKTSLVLALTAIGLSIFGNVLEKILKR